MKSLIKQSALITGASRGIGLASALSLVDVGLQVTGVGRDFSNTPETFNHTMCDLGNLDELTAQLTCFPSSVGVLILNAGIGQFGGLEQFSHAQIQRMVNVNLVSSLYISKHYLPLMKRQGGGDIVIVGSESAMQGARAGAVYCATKFALRGLAQSLRADCSTSNIRVHMVNPGPAATGFFDDLNFTPQEGQEFVLNAEDVAAAIVHALGQPRNVVTDEINLQPMKRSFRKK